MLVGKNGIYLEIKNCFTNAQIKSDGQYTDLISFNFDIFNAYQMMCSVVSE